MIDIKKSCLEKKRYVYLNPPSDINKGITQGDGIPYIDLQMLGAGSLNFTGHTLLFFLVTV